MMEDLKERELETARGTVRLPDCPALLGRFIEEGAAEDPDFQTIRSSVELHRDLSDGLLGLVNSAAYGLSRKVSTVQAALMILGVRNAAMLLTALAARGALVQPNDPFAPACWGHTSRIATLCGMIAQQLALVPRDLAHLYGLFRDSGALLLAPLDRQYAEALKRSGFLDTRTVAAFENRRFGTDHAALGARLAEHWSLPPAIAWGIARHHSAASIEETAPGLGRTGGILIGIGLVADELAARLEHKTHPEWRDERLPFVQTTLALDDAQFERLLDHGRKISLAR